jgi:ABC-type multidrug transport system fused ATPase/permease subunit
VPGRHRADTRRRRAIRPSRLRRAEAGTSAPRHTVTTDDRSKTAASTPKRSVVRQGLAVIRTGIQQEPRVFAGAVASSAIYGSMTVASAAIIGTVTNRVVIPAFQDGRITANALALSMLAITGVGLLKALGSRRLGASAMQYRLEATYRKQVTHQYLHVPIAWHHRHATGELLSTANADVEATWSTIMPLPMAVGVLVMLVVASVSMFLTDPVLAAVGIVIFPATLVLSLMAFSFFSGELVASVATGLILVIGVQLGVEGDVTLVQLIAFLFLANLFITPVQAGNEVFNDLQDALAGSKRLLGLLDHASEIADPGPGGIDLPPGPMDVQFDHVFYGYPGGPTVLHDVNLTLAAGSRVAIVGETGAGKTTFAMLIDRIMDPTAGRILVGGLPLAEIAFSSLRKRVVMVPQDGFLFDGTLSENIRNGRPCVTEDEMRLAFTELGLADWLASLPHDVDTPLGQRGESLSVGERLLVALVRAYIVGPDLLVLDEATPAIDPQKEMRLQHALERLTRGRTAIIIAHRLSTAEAADEVIVFHDGRVAKRGRHQELLAAEHVYAGLYRSWTPELNPR